MSNSVKLHQTVGIDLSRNTERSRPKDERVDNAAKLYESQFLREMVRAMRKTVPESEFMAPNMAEKIYREQADDQLVDTWVANGGIGLGDLIYDQMMERFFGASSAAGNLKPNQNQIQQGKQKPLVVPSFPIDGDQRIKLQRQRNTSTDNPSNTVSYRIQSESQGPRKITCPWNGVVSGNDRLGNDWNCLSIRHDNGLLSSLTYRGVPNSRELGQAIFRGEAIGPADSDHSEILWKIESLST